MAPSRRSSLLLLTVLAVALALRCWRLAADLPDFVEEAIPFRRALAMGGWQAGAPELHPHFFNYPSLVIYLHLALIRLEMLLGLASGHLEAAADFWLQCQHDPTVAVLVARGLSIAADLATIAGVWRLTRRHGALPAAVAASLVAVAGPMVRTGRLIQVDPVQAALTVWSLERLLAWHAGGGRGRLTAATVLVGLAAGAKYQGGMLVLPLAWVLWSREGGAGLRRWPVLAAAALGVFLLTTPFAALDPASFWHDLRFELRHMEGGHLGSAAGASPAFVARALWQGLGPLGLLAALAGLLAPLWQRRRPGAQEIVIWTAVAPLLAAMLLARVQAERYLVPLIPLLAVAAGAGLAALLAQPALRPRPWTRPLLAVAVLLPPLAASWASLPPGGGHDQVQARRWLEASVGPQELVLSERYTGRLRNVGDDAALREHPAWSRCSPAARAAFDQLPRFRNIELPLVVSGEVTLAATDLAGRPRGLTVVPHATDLNAIFYARQLLLGVDWVQVSASIRSRHEADPARYGEQVAWYRFLDDTARKAAIFAAGTGTAITIYRLDPAVPQLTRTLDPLWWTDPISSDFRHTFEACCVPPDARTSGARYDQDGRLAAWVQGLRGYFERHVAPFLVRLGSEHAAVGRLEAARQALLPVMLVAPQLDAALVELVMVCRRQDDLLTAELLLERSLAMRRGLGDDISLVHLLLAGLRVDQDRLDEARRLAAQVRDDPAAPTAYRERAQELLRHLAENDAP